MTGSSLSPFAVRLLHRLVPQHWRESIEGDLAEECRQRRETKRPAGWIWQSSAALVVAKLAETRILVGIMRTQVA